jgi:hypothetical protein
LLKYFFLEQNTLGLTWKKEIFYLLHQTPIVVFTKEEQCDDTCELNITKDNQTTLTLIILDIASGGYCKWSMMVVLYESDAQPKLGLICKQQSLG